VHDVHVEQRLPAEPTELPVRVLRAGIAIGCGAPVDARLAER
jgi:hypothetical protein